MDEDRSADQEEMRRTLEAAMREFGRQRANLFAARQLFNRRLIQGAGVLIFDCVLLGLGVWAPLCLLVAALAVWWIVQAVGISEICDEFQDAAVNARQRLQGLLARPGTGELYQALYDELEGYEYREWLAEFLPGPVEVRRR